MVDSASLQREIEDQWGGFPGLTLASISFDSVGVADSVRVWSESLPDVSRASLAVAIQGSILGGVFSTERVDLFIADAEGPSIRRVDDFRRCAPVLLRERDTARRIESEAAVFGNVEQRRVVRIRLFVETDGGVGEVRVEVSSGDTNADFAAVRVFRNATFRPAQVEGIPVAVWISLPITFTPPGESK